MNKRSLRSFGFGVLFAVTVLGTTYYTSIEKTVMDQPSIKSAMERLKKDNYVVLNQKEFKAIKHEIRLKAEKELVEDNNKKLKEQNEVTKALETTIVYHLEVVSGMTSSDIVKKLLKAKIIDDAKKMQSYLDKNGYSTQIQLGTFVLTSDMSFQQIAKTITKS